MLKIIELIFIRLRISPYLFVFCFSSVYAQNTVGVLNYDATKAYDGYNLLFPTGDTNTYLIDNCGRVVHEWSNQYTPGQVAFLLEDGNLLRTYSKGQSSNPVFSMGGASDGIQLIDWNGTILWDYVYSSSLYRMHHDVAYMSNGHILLHAWELKNKAEAMDAGYDSTQLPTNKKVWSEGIFEIEPTGSNGGNIIWEWHIWDHLVQDFNPIVSNYGVISNHPELIDINFNLGDNDVFHVNGIDYNEDLDQIIISVHDYGEVWILDHSTTTSEAATHSGGKSGKGGDLLYRWGNPQVYGAGTANDQIFFGQHNAHWIPKGLVDEGKIMVFNNGAGGPGGKYSSVEIFVPPFDSVTNNYAYSSGNSYAPALSEWIYTSNPKTSFYSNAISGAQRLSNGNTLICSGSPGTIFEVNSDSVILWKYVVPLNGSTPITQGQSPTNNSTFRCYRYGTNYSGLSGKILAPGNYIEINPDTTLCDSISTGNIMKSLHSDLNINVFPNPTSDVINVVSSTKIESIRIFDEIGKTIYKNNIADFSYEIKVSGFPAGMYFLKVDNSVFKILRN